VARGKPEGRHRVNARVRRSQRSSLGIRQPQSPERLLRQGSIVGRPARRYDPPNGTRGERVNYVILIGEGIDNAFDAGPSTISVQQRQAKEELENRAAEEQRLRDPLGGENGAAEEDRLKDPLAYSDLRSLAVKIRRLPDGAPDWEETTADMLLRHRQPSPPRRHRCGRPLQARQPRDPRTDEASQSPSMVDS
jgi:hypothetical protein